jgi:hypothetical protein
MARKSELFERIAAVLQFPLIFRNFAVELFAGPSIALHINARFGHMNDGDLVCNAMIGNQWGTELRTKNPFRFGVQFRLTIQIEQQHYMV